jgi:putative acetyltransferase
MQEISAFFDNGELIFKFAAAARRPGESHSVAFQELYDDPMHAAITICLEYNADVEAIRNVHQRAFPTDAESRLVDRLRADGQLSISLIAHLAGGVVGHVALSPITIDGYQVGLGLAPVAVVPEHQKSAIGSALVRQSLIVCREASVPMVVVLGEPQFYSRFGFVPASQYGLHSAYGGGDAFQAMLLVTDQPPPKGLVQYAPAFAMLG